MQFHSHTLSAVQCVRWNLPQVGKAVLLKLMFLIVVLTLTALSALGQDTVPPTAVQAAKMPQFAAKLAHASHMGRHGGASRLPSPQRASHRSLDGPYSRFWAGQPLDVYVMYDDGPINGTVDGWAINFGYAVSDSFTVSQQNNVAGLNFGAWLYPGDVIQSVEVSITSSEFGGTTYFDSVVNLSQSNCTSNQYGYNVCTIAGTFPDVAVNAGTYWVNLQNAVVNNGDPVFWDENSGPSMASESSVGTIPAESFSVLGDSGITCAPLPRERIEGSGKAAISFPSLSQIFKIIYSFTGGADGGATDNPLTIDAAGNLYGTSSGGPLGAGTAFKLTPTPSGWRYARLYSFSAPNGSGPDSALVQDAGGALYGTTNVGGGSDQGVLFKLAPPAHIPPSVFTNWMEHLLYSFNGDDNGSWPRGDLVVDDSSNIFGTAGGGANGAGVLYSFANGNMRVLHAFSSFPSDGTVPTGLTRTQGHLYGLTAWGGRFDGGTIYTWNGIYQSLYSFQPGTPEGNPISLASDQAGNLYGTTSWWSVAGCMPYGGRACIPVHKQPPNDSSVRVGRVRSAGRLRPCFD
jgi:uncharacterized repeat protein (TIGR03803 family)